VRRYLLFLTLKFDGLVHFAVSFFELTPFVKDDAQQLVRFAPIGRDAHRFASFKKSPVKIHMEHRSPVSYAVSLQPPKKNSVMQVCLGLVQMLRRLDNTLLEISWRRRGLRVSITGWQQDQ
jgi:hypothetical protein